MEHIQKRGGGILTAAIQGEGEKMIYQQEGNINAYGLTLEPKNPLHDPSCLAKIGFFSTYLNYHEILLWIFGWNKNNVIAQNNW